MSALTIPKHAGTLFDWKGGHGVTEASCLGHPMMARVWDDACDVGFHVESQRTGRTVLFTLVRPEAVDGEVVAWHFEAYAVELRGKFKVTIFND